MSLDFQISGPLRAVHSGGTLLATQGERNITQILKEKLSPSYVEVRDISGLYRNKIEVYRAMYALSSRVSS